MIRARHESIEGHVKKLIILGKYAVDPGIRNGANAAVPNDLDAIETDDRKNLPYPRSNRYRDAAAADRARNITDS